ncbi:MAG: PEP-CTERM sorting domain-containing protein [Planctomycetes bacterium]|nr:PEP-CTERM sorting domain-containing protein [Planctomycetota bacterium]
MLRPSLPATCVILLACIAHAPITLGQASFQGVGYEPGYGSVAAITSADGMFVTGNAGQDGHVPGDTEAFLWTAGGGMVFLGDLPGGPTRSWGKGIAADGTVVIGEGRYGDDPMQYEAIHWSADTGLVGLAFLTGGTFTTAEGVSADGLVVVGTGNSADRSREAFRWTQAEGMVGLGGLKPGATSYAFNISADGTTVVGNAVDAYPAAAYWNETDGWVSIGKLNGGSDGLGAFATNVSTDGSIIAGNSSSTLVPFSYEPFIWSEANGMLGLGLLYPSDEMATVTGMTGDGSVVVGVSGQFSGPRFPYIWDATNGMRNLAEVLVNDYGLDLTGWILVEVLDVSLDGTTFVGYGTNPEGVTEGWIARIPADTGPQLAVDSACPDSGPATVSWTNATPNGTVGLLFAANEGSVVIPIGPCAGSTLGLGAQRLQLLMTAITDADGNGSIQRTAPAIACGSYLQLIDASTCETSNVARIE